MMIYPPIAELVKKAGSRYSLVIETAKRARQLSQGAPAFAESDSNKEVAIAANEIYEGKLSAVSPSQLEQHRINITDDVPAEEENSENTDAENDGEESNESNESEESDREENADFEESEDDIAE